MTLFIINTLRDGVWDTLYSVIVCSVICVSVVCQSDIKLGQFNYVRNLCFLSCMPVYLCRGPGSTTRRRHRGKHWVWLMTLKACLAHSPEAFLACCGSVPHLFASRRFFDPVGTCCRLGYGDAISGTIPATSVLVRCKCSALAAVPTGSSVVKFPPGRARLLFLRNSSPLIIWISSVSLKPGRLLWSSGCSRGLAAILKSNFWLQAALLSFIFLYFWTAPLWAELLSCTTLCSDLPSTKVQ